MISLSRENYQQLFQLSSVPYLVSDIFSAHYRTLQCVLAFADREWISYLPKSVVERTLNDGVALYRDRKLFEKYRDDFKGFREGAAAQFAQALAKDSLARADVVALLDILRRNFYFYSRTEFFYTDRAAEVSYGNTEMEKTLHELGEIKNVSREFLNNLFFGDSSKLNLMLKKISAQTGIQRDALWQCSGDEILSFFDGGKPDEGMIHDRGLAYVVLGDGENITVVLGDEASVIARSLAKSSPTEIGLIRGRTANPGIARGSVKIIHSGYDHFDTVESVIASMVKGQILVADTTSPELMSACRKAAAIVTNQGGLLSHAAIVSRELGIPCIVGTTNATKVLKDGDLVEVDAEKGVVRKLH